MIFRLNPESQISFTKSSASLFYPYPRSSSSLPWDNNSASIRPKFGTCSNLVVGHSSSLKDLQLGWAANFSEEGFVRQSSERVDRWIAGNSVSRLPIRASSMPRPVGSASFYPIRGLYFFLRQENRVVLWKRIAKFAAEVGAATVAIVGSLVGFTFHAQKTLLLQVLPHSLHFFGIPGTVVLILIEAAIPLTLIFYRRTLRVQEKLFVDVLNLQGITVEKTSDEERSWINEQRQIQLRQNQLQRPNIFRTLADPETLNNRPITKYIVTLPLNFIPVAGQAAFCWLNSMDTSTMLHHYYYSKLKGLSAEEEAAVIHFRKAQYQQFGLTATLLDLFPGPNILFVLTNSVGAALWAADIEKAMQKRHSL